MSLTSSKPTDTSADGKLGMPILLRVVLGLGIILGWALVVGALAFFFGVLSISRVATGDGGDFTIYAAISTAILSLGGGLVPGVLVWFDRLALALVAGQVLLALTMVSGLVMVLLSFM